MLSIVAERKHILKGLNAKTLAHLTRIDKDLLHPIRHRSEKAQADPAMKVARADV